MFYYMLLNGIIKHKTKGLANIVDEANKSLPAESHINYSTVHYQVNKTGKFDSTVFVGGIECLLSIQKKDF